MIGLKLKGGLPTLILQNLRRGPNHGYCIAREIKEKSKGVLDFNGPEAPPPGPAAS